MRLLKALLLLAAAGAGLAVARRRLITLGELPANATRPEPGGPALRPEPTRDELYQRAKRLDIPGRSKMTKAQLAEAVGAEV